MFLDLQTMLNPIRYQRMGIKPMSCVEAVNAWAGPLNQLLKHHRMKVDGGTWLQYGRPIPIRYGPSQTGQEVLTFKTQGTDDYGILDVAAYLLDLSYNDIPIAVGDKDLLERAMSEIYSGHLPQPVDITIHEAGKR